jgi:esterase/lipase superfamily enzyme
MRVPVLYATDRAERRNPKTPDEMFGADRGELSYGIAEISIPDDPRMGKDNPHKRGRIERPHWWRLEFREDPLKHVVVQEVRKFVEADFVQRVRLLSRRSEAHEALIFVHGYRTGFSDALRRTAQVAYDLQFGGVPILFSWPSEAATIPYTVDETNVLDSRPRFRHALNLVSEQMDLDGIHMISHSMGGRLVAEALSGRSFEQPILHELVFAAPDIDAKTFQDLADEFKRCARRVTL